MQQHNQTKRSLHSLPPFYAGLPVRTNLRGGVCVDVNDQVKAALQTLTTALGGATNAAVPPAAATNAPTTSS